MLPRGSHHRYTLRHHALYPALATPSLPHCTQRLELSAFDPDNTGSLTTEQLEEYVKSLVPQVSALSDMQVGGCCVGGRSRRWGEWTVGGKQRGAGAAEDRVGEGGMLQGCCSSGGIFGWLGRLRAGAGIVASLSDTPSPLPLLPQQPSFLKDYGRIAVRKLLFFHGKNGAVRIRDLVNSIVLQVWAGGRKKGNTRGLYM